MVAPKASLSIQQFITLTFLSHISYILYNMDIKIVNYKTALGKEPFDDWLAMLDASERAIIRARINRIRLGNFGDHHTINGAKGVFELRLDHGPGYRIYFGRKANIVVILLIGGTKRTQTRDIKKAKQYWDDYRE